MSDKIRHKEKNMDMHDIQGGEKKVMTKFNKKMINVFATAALVAGVAAPVAAITAPTAIHAATGISANNPPTVKDGGFPAFASVNFSVGEGATIRPGDSVSIKLPFDLPAPGAVTGDTYAAQNGNSYVFNPSLTNTAGPNGVRLSDNGVQINGANVNADEFVVTLKNADTINLTYTGTGTAFVEKEDLRFTLRLGALEVEDGESGSKEVTFDGPSSTAFPLGKVVVGNVNDSDDLNLSFGSLDTSNNEFTPKIVIVEPTAGSLNGSTEIKVKLPNGYAWTGLASGKSVDRIYGNVPVAAIKLDRQNNNQELVITYDASKDTRSASEKTASKFEIPYNFAVEDSSLVKKGDVIARVSGKTSTNLADAKIGTYGDFGTGLTATDAPTIVAGKHEQDTADLILKQNIDDSLINGRTIELTLPEGTAWQPVFEAVYEDSARPNYSNLEAPGGKADLKNKDVTLRFDGYTGTDRRTAKYTIKGQGEISELKWENIEIATAADFAGDVTVTLGGNAGVTGSAVIAKVVAPVTAAAATKPNVIIGSTTQKAADFTITETQAEAFKYDRTVVLDLPNGVYFTSTPKVEVTSGDLRISNVKRLAGDNQVQFTVDSDSSTASTLKVSDVNITLDRTVPEGDVTLEVTGKSVNETSVYTSWTNSSVAKVAIANTATPAPTDQSAVETVFTLGSTSYTVNGETKTADVAPYSENGRTYLPVRYVADALGVTPQNILFDKATSTVTLLKGDRVVQIKLNTNQLIINGSVVPMDVKAVTKDNRTVLPIRWVGQALGVNVSYDETAKTVTIK
ncbi:hypothetical protein D3C74_28310 [compost metagenome]